VSRRKSYNLADMSYVDVADYLKEKDVVIAPMGSTEKHGAHLPLGTDSFTTIRVVEKAASLASVPYAPLTAVGYSPHHMGELNCGSGTLTFSSETYRHVVYDLAKSLTETEKLEIVERFVRMKGDKVLMVGTGCESTRQTIEFTNRVADLGADFASIITPHYFASRMDDNTLIAYYQEIADRSAVPVLLYNIPKLANGVTISTRAAGVLSSHPNIWGMKDSGGASVFAFLAALSGREFSVLAGSADYYLPALFLGAEGGIISLANCFPEVCGELHAEATSGSADNARRLHLRILQANRAVSSKYGVAGVKAAMQLAGYQGGDPRRPLAPLTDDHRRRRARRVREGATRPQKPSAQSAQRDPNPSLRGVDEAVRGPHGRGCSPRRARRSRGPEAGVPVQPRCALVILDGHNEDEFHGRVERELVVPQGRACVSGPVPEDLREEVGGPVEHLRVPGPPGSAVHMSFDADDRLQLVERAELGLDLGQGV